MQKAFLTKQAWFTTCGIMTLVLLASAVNSQEYVMASWSLGLALFVGITMFLYLMPTFVAFHRKHRNRWPLLALNVLFGWSFIGWVACLVWACVAKNLEAEEQTVSARPQEQAARDATSAHHLEEEMLSMLSRLKAVYERGGIDKEEYHRLRDPIVDKILAKKAA